MLDKGIISEDNYSKKSEVLNQNVLSLDLSNFLL
jgi:hypothetical protein